MEPNRMIYIKIFKVQKDDFIYSYFLVNHLSSPKSPVGHFCVEKMI